MIETEDLINYILRKEMELEKAKILLIDSDISDGVFLNNLGDVLENRFHSFRYLLNTDRKNGIDKTKFNIYLEKKLSEDLNNYFKEYIPYYYKRLSVKYRQSSGFDCFRVDLDGKELFQFNPFEKYYGVRKRPLSEEHVEIKINEIKKSIKKERDNTEELLIPYQNLLKNKFKYSKGFKNKLFCLFNSDKVDTYANNNIIRENEILNDIINGKLRELEILIDADRDIFRIASLNVVKGLEKLFKDLGYFYMHNKAKLY